jgi:RNase adapter protein RapZ
MTPKPSQRQRLLVVTGMSGAGRSTALKALEDMGYEAVDNLPLSLLPNLIGPRAMKASLAIGVDVRTRDFAVPALLKALDELVQGKNVELKMVFLDCDDDRLERRYTETRRRHPLAAERPVADGVRIERQRLWPLRDRADLVIDTSSLTPADLKRQLQGHFGLETAPGIAIFVTSFSYRHGLPRDADLVFDMRFLQNPHYVAELRPLTGRDRAVGEFIEADRDLPRASASSAIGSRRCCRATRAKVKVISPSPSAAPAGATARSMSPSASPPGSNPKAVMSACCIVISTGQARPLPPPPNPRTP